VSGRKDSKSILTEDEIAALGASFDTPRSNDDGEYCRYDVSAREALILANWDVLLALMADQGAATKTIFKRQFRVDLSATCLPPVWVSAQDAVVAVPERALLVSTEINPFTGPSYLSISADLIDCIVSQYACGAPIKDTRLKGPLISSERRLGERIAGYFLGAMADIWSRHLRLSIGDLDSHETTTQLILEPAINGFVKFGYAFFLGQGPASEISLLLPFEGLRRNAAKLMTRQVPEEKRIQEINRTGELYRVLPDIPVEVAGVLTSQTLSISDLLATRIGSVIPMNDQMEVDLYVGNTCFAKGHYDVELGTRACRITKLQGRS